ncbi:MAG: hypothetical protein JNM67_08895, partial [Bacteroidetes bacterium]|nr:hypothetical protein [Bacteroidota bacterium]
RVYRYGFNGKEKDFETSSDNYDFGARIYDGRLGRWLSLDPLMKKYPGISPYNFAINNPISFFDCDGKDARLTVDNNAKTITLQTTVFLYGKDAKDVDLVALQTKWNSLPTTKTIKDDLGNEWTVKMEVTFARAPSLDSKETYFGSPISKNFTEQELTEVGYKQGDNFMEIDNRFTPVGGEIGHAYQGHGMAESHNKTQVILHETFHQMGFDERHLGGATHDGFIDDILTTEGSQGTVFPKTIHTIHFVDLLDFGLKNGTGVYGLNLPGQKGILSIDNTANGTIKTSDDDLKKANEKEVKK